MAITYHEDIRNGMLAGIDKLADLIKVTLGPRGRNVAMYQKQNVRDAEYSERAKSGAHVLVTNDGATIAKSVVLPDPIENMGAQFLKEIASKTNDIVGDGTTTASVLTQSILHEAFKSVSAGANPVAVRRGVEKTAKVAAKELILQANIITTQEDIAQVAAISCEDKALGDMIGTALYTVGLDGVIKVDESRRFDTSLELLEGIVFERGFLSPLMTTDDKKTVAELHNPYILICDQKFTDPKDLLPFLILCAEDERSCLIISDGVEGEAMGMILKNKLEGDMDIVCVLAPLYGEGRRWHMEDLAIQAGGVFIAKELCMDVRKVTREMVGTAEYVKVTKQQTAMIGPGGDPVAVENRINEIKNLIENSDYEFNKERYQERLAKFVSGVAKIGVGGRTQTELWERKMRVEDAVNAARAAYEEGVVAGGGVALLNLIPSLHAFAESLEGDERIGAMAVVHAMKAPTEQIADNAGINGTVAVERLLHEQPNIGYDAENDCYVNMLEAGIIDPVKVTRLALETALSVAAALLTTEAGISK